MSTLQKAYDAGYLSRFVIDEAHCTSTLASLPAPLVRVHH